MPEQADLLCNGTFLRCQAMPMDANKISKTVAIYARVSTDKQKTDGELAVLRQPRCAAGLRNISGRNHYEYFLARRHSGHNFGLRFLLFFAFFAFFDEENLLKRDEGRQGVVTACPCGATQRRQTIPVARQIQSSRPYSCFTQGFNHFMPMHIASDSILLAISL